MKRYLCISILVFLIIIIPAAVFAGNTGNITQKGKDNECELYQFGSYNQITQTQNGYYNYAYAYQDGNGNIIIQYQEKNYNYAEAWQIGNNNKMDWKSYGSGYQYTVDIQIGNNNTIVNYQGLTGIPVNIIQNGNGMKAFIY